MATAHQHVHRLPYKELKVLYPAWPNMFLRMKTLHSQVVKTQWPQLINMFIKLHDKELKSLVSYLGGTCFIFWNILSSCLLAHGHTENTIKKLTELSKAPFHFAALLTAVFFCQTCAGPGTNLFALL